MCVRAREREKEGALARESESERGKETAREGESERARARESQRPLIVARLLLFTQLQEPDVLV